MFSTKYVRLLERQNEQLLGDIERLNNRIVELTNAFIPALRQRTETLNLQLKPKVIHKIEHKDNDNFAKCPCGWTSVSDDPAELQEAIGIHYRETLPFVKTEPRKSWPLVKVKLEQAS